LLSFSKNSLFFIAKEKGRDDKHFGFKLFHITQAPMSHGRDR
jgi:hypothetical protein